MALAVSVAMTVYNGEDYLYEQLESIYSQTRMPDELIICDDGSTDNSKSIFDKFKKDKHIGDTWKYFINKSNKGPMKNFIDCASMCSGDIIFFSDQDDIWDSKKISSMLRVFMQKSDALAVACSEQYISSDGKIIKQNILNSKGHSKKVFCEKVSFASQVKTMYSPGLTLAVRKALVKEIIPLVYEDDMTYDITSGLVSAAKGGMYRVYRPYVYRRIHSSNASSPIFSVSQRSSSINLHIKGRKLQLHHMKVILKKYSTFLTEKDKKNLEKRITTTQESISYLEKDNILGLAKLVLTPNPMENSKLNLANVLIAFTHKIKTDEDS